MKFYKKSDAIVYFTNNKQSNIKLFQNDINISGAKEFIITKPSVIFNYILQEEKSHYYEFWTDKCNLLFALDIDCISDTINIIKLINNVIDGAKQYYNYTYLINDIIVLQNDNFIQDIESPNKKSYHIIFRGLAFKTYIVCRDFYMRLCKDYDMNHCDKAIYNMTCLRVAFCSKITKNAILKPIKIIINDTHTHYLEATNNTITDLKNFWKLSLITYLQGHEYIIDKCVVCLQQHVIQNLGEFTQPQSYLENILFKLPEKYYNDYDTWIKIGMILYNTSITNDIDLFNIWNIWSSKSKKYKSQEMISIWNSFNKPSKKKIGIGTLIKWAKDENIIEKTKNIYNTVNNYPIVPVQLSYNDKSYIILDCSKLSIDTFINYLDVDILAIQSEKGTGKTYNLINALFNNKTSINDDTTILFITSRRTFGFKLLSDLKNIGFKLYSDITNHYICSRRIICQLDSLLRLDLDTYDYIIIDECESVARYITSQHFVKNNKSGLIVNSLINRIYNAKHVYIMDADLSDRSINFYTSIKKDHKNLKVQIIINTFKLYSTYTIKYMSYTVWLYHLFKKIDEDKKIIIPMASNNKAKDIYLRIIQIYTNLKILLINKESSDEEKFNNLININEDWSGYDIIIYTPSISMGVSYDYSNYFDYIFAYGCFNSLGSQEFCQMLHRVRNPKYLEIYISIDNYKEYHINDTISYKMAEQILCSDYYLTHYDLHNNTIPKTINKTHIEYPYKHDPIYELYVRNCQELVEDNLNFCAKLFGYLKYKEYILEFIDNPSEKHDDIISELKKIKLNREVEEDEILVNNIYNAVDITEEEFKYKINQKNNLYKYEIIRHSIVKCYNIPLNNIQNILTKEFIKKYKSKNIMKWFKNITTIIDHPDQSTEIKLNILKTNAIDSKSYKDNCYLDFSITDKYIYHYYAITIINMLNYDINNLKIEIKHDDMVPKINSVLEWCNTCKIDIVKTYNIINFIKYELNKLDNANEKIINRLKFINKILLFQYGLKITKINNKIPTYIISFINEKLWSDINPYNYSIKLILKNNIIIENNIDFSLYDKCL